MADIIPNRDARRLFLHLHALSDSPGRPFRRKDLPELIRPTNDPRTARQRTDLRALCSGLLAALGIIDCDAIGAATARPAGALDNDYVRILQLVDMERWARSIAEAPKSGGQ